MITKHSKMSLIAVLFLTALFGYYLYSFIRDLIDGYSVLNTAVNSGALVLFALTGIIAVLKKERRLMIFSFVCLCVPSVYSLTDDVYYGYISDSSTGFRADHIFDLIELAVPVTMIILIILSLRNNKAVKRLFVLPALLLIPPRIFFYDRYVDTLGTRNILMIMSDIYLLIALFACGVILTEYDTENQEENAEKTSDKPARAIPARMMIPLVTVLCLGIGAAAYQIYDNNRAYVPSSAKSSGTGSTGSSTGTSSTGSKSYSSGSSTSGGSSYSGGFLSEGSSYSVGSTYSSDSLAEGEYFCMGKGDTCKNKTYSPTDLYCHSCDPDDNNVEGDQRSSKSYGSGGKVIDNNSDGKVDEDDWEKAWGDYLNDKYDDYGIGSGKSYGKGGKVIDNNYDGKVDNNDWGKAWGDYLNDLYDAYGY